MFDRAVPNPVRLARRLTGLLALLAQLLVSAAPHTEHVTLRLRPVLKAAAEATAVAQEPTCAACVASQLPASPRPIERAEAPARERVLAAPPPGPALLSFLLTYTLSRAPPSC